MLIGCVGDGPRADWKLSDETIDQNNDHQPLGSHRRITALSNRSKIRCKTSRHFRFPNLTSVVLLVVMGCFHAQGFSSFKILSDTNRFETMRHQRSNRTQKNQRKCYLHNNSNRNPRSATAVCSKPTSVEEATIALDWTEYFAPTTDDDDETAETPVLFLHGLLGNKRNFATCASMLANQVDKKRRILGVDLRNHGSTQPWSEEMSYPSMAQDVVNFLNSQNIQKVILVGHSMGGKVAQALALLHPQYVEGLVVLDIAPVEYSREEDPHWRAVEDILRAVHGVIEEATSSGTETTKRDIDLSLRKSIPDPALRAFVLTNFDSRKNEWKIPIATMVQELEQIAGFDLTSVDYDASSTYDGDVFIINGGQSRFVRHSYMDQIASYFPNHMLTTIRGSGHWVHAEAPEDLVALLTRYLDR